MHGFRLVAAASTLVVGLVAAGQSPSASQFVNGPTYRGMRITADFPASERMWNVGSKVDGAGMCVTTSVEMCARYAGLDDFRGFRDWAAKEPGGAWPEKLADQVTRYAKAKGIPAPAYVQYYGDAPEELVDLIDRTGRPAAIAYGRDPRYASAANPSGAIGHMVACVFCGREFGTILDNNALGIARDDAHQYVWMSRSELFDRMKTTAHGGPFGRATPVKTKAWVFCWLAPPAPPAPFTP